MIRCAREGRKWAPRCFLYQTVSRVSIKDRNGARFDEQIRTYTHREIDREEMTRGDDADRCCPAATRQSRNIRGRNVARRSPSPPWGLLSCTAWRRASNNAIHDETKGSFHRRKRGEPLYIPSWTNHLRRPTIPDSCVIPCQAGMIARSPSSCNDQTINVSRCRTISIYPFWRNQSLGTSLPNWKLKSRGDRSFVRLFRKTHFDKYKYNL